MNLKQDNELFSTEAGPKLPSVKDNNEHQLMQQDLLTKMEDLLNDGGLNYSTFLRSYTVEGSPSTEFYEVVQKAISEDIAIDSLRDVSFAEIEANLRECLSYEGMEGAGPQAGVTRTSEFFALLENICKDVKIESERSLALKSFRFQKGHPAYPVFWDFAYAFLGERTCTILICSSSD